MEEHWEPYPKPRSNYRAEEDEYTFSSHYNPNDSELLNIEDDLYNVRLIYVFVISRKVVLTICHCIL